MDLSGGYVKAYRKTLKSDMYQSLTATQRDVFWACLLLASHTPKKWEWGGQIFECQPGQFITSLASLQKLCAKNTSIKQIRTSVLKLEKWDFLANKGTKSGRLITIRNWDKYQTLEIRKGKDTGKEGAKKGQRRGNYQEGLRMSKNTYTVNFDSFWNSYPRKINKQEAFKAWQKCNGDRPELDELLVIIEKHKKSREWKKENGQFIPYPSTWLNSKRWEDEIPEDTSHDDDPPYWSND